MVISYSLAPRVCVIVVQLDCVIVIKSASHGETVAAMSSVHLIIFNDNNN